MVDSDRIPGGDLARTFWIVVATSAMTAKDKAMAGKAIDRLSEVAGGKAGERLVESLRKRLDSLDG